MAFPPGFLDEIKSRVSLSHVAGKKVTWDSRKSNPAKGDYWAPCPFHQEKTPSFHVDDAKGFYYCFGCHEKGDIVGFTMATENLSFIEAVERLAGEAGLEMPTRDPKAREKSDARTRLVAVMETATQFFRLQLKTAAADQARDYLTKRGLNEDHQTRFEIGFASNTRTALTDHLKGKGISDEDIITAGLAIKPDDGSKPFDRFRNRIIFPIRDPQNRAIAFGGRALDPNARAKYLNSPETPLFDKGRTLYNFSPAREASGKSGALIVAEGYMDVIALVTHGFAHTIAPNGTAITPDQLRLMWRIAPEPIIALDGDQAGQRAAARLIDIALPLLEAGKSLRFSVLPTGLDPDDLLRQQGPAAMQTLFDKSKPLFDLMWERETGAAPLDTPERRAAFDQRLKSILHSIEDASVRRHYDAEIRTRRRALFTPQQTNPRQNIFSRGASRGPAKRGAAARPIPPSLGTKNSALATAGSDAIATRMRETTILGLCLAHPIIISACESALESVVFQTPELAQLRDALITHSASDGNAQGSKSLKDKIISQIGPHGLEMVETSNHLKTHPLIKSGTDALVVQAALLDDISRHRAILGRSSENLDAQSDITSDHQDEGLTWRSREAMEAEERAARVDFDSGKGDASSDQSGDDYFKDLFDREVWIKK